ncbi:hypothetical protein RVR_523 [Actinacidiphila reveromycinica]|uniref:Carboxymuconolactone decarboxylase-like domain-containing protein n=1 Tax=Actinacidiphila reveromycinica TaxID=659352 RepID=A0A7U3VLJ9_9ACTN|nr:carboxymuconolactone decarboxylase family protein [Streptomyces sp. SN-593]BBA95604.1 hypothetical protein RVR_523 [Streptomyces sp. SN-593]
MTASRTYRAPRPAELDEEQRGVRATVLEGSRAPQRALLRLEDDEERLLGPFGLALLSPGIGSRSLAVGAAFRAASVLTARGREIAILTVAAVTGCSYERYAHAAVGRSAGLTEEEVAALLDGRFPGRDAVERAVHGIALAYLAASSGEGPALPEEAVAVLDDRALYELVMLLGHYRSLALAMDVFGVGAPR